MRFILIIAALMLAGCCGNSTPQKVEPERFQVVSDQYMVSKRHSNFSIMIIKDTKTEKQFRVVYNSQWGVVSDDN